MQLRVARLCLDCEEVHQELHCPVCASDSFAYLSRWIPVEERRTTRRTPKPATPKPQTGRGRWIAGGAVGLAALVTTQLLFGGKRGNNKAKATEAATDDKEIQN